MIQNIYPVNLVKIECLSKVPPKCYFGFTTNVYTDAILYVPVGCKEAYSNAEVWKNFWNIEEEAVESGIVEIINNANNDTHYQVYDLMGCLILRSDDISEFGKLPKGIYIVINKNRKYKILI